MIDSTDDKVCGAECLDGSLCQHPAGSCPVPSHSDDDTVADGGNPQGRPDKFTDDRAQEAIQAARDSLSKSGCGRAAGVGHQTIGRWVEKNPSFEDEFGEERQFRTVFRRARNAGEATLVDEGLRNPDVDSSMAKFLLSTSFGYVKTERREHLVDDDADLAGEQPTADFVVIDDDDGDDDGDE